MSPTETLIPTALVFLVLQSPLVICAGWFAPILGARRWVWVALTAIPWVGLLFGYVLLFRAFGALLKALEKHNQLRGDKQLENRLGLGSTTVQRRHRDLPAAKNAAFPERLIG